MKMFVVLALVAAVCAEPEADPQLLYSTGVHSSVMPATYTGAPLTTYSPLMKAFRSVYTTPAVYSAQPAVYSSPAVYSAPFVHALGKREAEADPAVVYNAHHVASPVVYNAHHSVATVAASPVVSYNNVVAPVTSYSHVAAAAPVATVAAAPVATYSHVAAAAPVATYSHVSPVATYRQVAAPVATYSHVAPVAATHSVTSYNNPHHYTAVSNGVVGPKYVAKNHGVAHIVKREAEADPAVLYSAHHVASPVVSSYAAHHAVATPVVSSYAAHHAVATPVVSSYAANHAVATPVVSSYAAVAAPAVYKTAPHAVAATPFGYTHSSNVGVCTNNMGVQVPC